MQHESGKCYCPAQHDMTKDYASVAAQRFCWFDGTQIVRTLGFSGWCERGHQWTTDGMDELDEPLVLLYGGGE